MAVRYLSKNRFVVSSGRSTPANRHASLLSATHQHIENENEIKHDISSTSHTVNTRRIHNVGPNEEEKKRREQEEEEEEET